MKRFILGLTSFFLMIAMVVPVFAEEAEEAANEGGMPWWAVTLIVAVVVGFIISLIVNLVLRAKLKSVRPDDAAENYVIDNSLDVTESRELYLYTRTTSVRKPTSNNDQN